MPNTDTTVPGQYQQPIRNFRGRDVVDFVEFVDFVPNSNMRIWYNNVAEGYPIHRHSAIEIAIPTKNKYKYIFDEEIINLNEGDILIVPPDVLHKITCNEEGVRFIYLFNVDFINNFFDSEDFAKLLSKPLLINSDTYPEIYKDIYDSFMRINDLYFFYSMTVKEIPIFAELLSVLSKLVKTNYTDEVLIPQTDKQRKVYFKFKNLIEHVNMNMDKNITLDEAANYVGYSRYHFSRTFKEYTGITYNEYIANKKLSLAIRMLESDNARVSDIAMKLGYKNAAQFSRIFHRECGMSPREYRVEYLKKKEAARTKKYRSSSK